MATTISHNGITWTLAGDRQHGTFIDGHPWVLIPAGQTDEVTAISPAFYVHTYPGGATRPVHGSELNLQMQNAAGQPGGTAANVEAFFQGLDGITGGGRVYKEALNVGKTIAEGTPLEVAPGDSLISVESNLGQTSEQSATVLRASVLTFVSTVPAANQFRPPYWGPNKPSTPYYWSDGMLAKLPRIPELNSFFFGGWWAGNADWLATRAKALQLIIGHGEGQWRLMPSALCEPYYAWRMQELGWAMLALCADVDPMLKRELAIALVQQGIDFGWAVKNGFYCANTHATGRKPPIVFAALMLQHADFDDVNGMCRDDLQTFVSGHDRDHRVVFGEDGQTFFVEETAPGVFNYGHGGYTAGHVGNPDWGNTHTMADAVNDLADWNAMPPSGQPGYRNNEYRRCCASSAWVGVYLAMTAMGAVKLWNWPAFFAYTRRWAEEATFYGAEPMHSALPFVWNVLKPQILDNDVSPSVRQIGLAGAGTPKIAMLNTPTATSPWQLRITTGIPGQRLGLLVRAEETAKYPAGAQLQDIGVFGLLFLDLNTVTGSLTFTTDANGEATISMQPIDAQGETYTVQAGVLDPQNRLMLTPALEVTIQ